MYVNIKIIGGNYIKREYPRTENHVPISQFYWLTELSSPELFLMPFL
jgi:hypothetical protein